MSTTHVAFIGLGNMGGPMAANLVKAGHTVTGYDPVPAAAEAAAANGIEMAESAAAAAKDAPVVITMLPTGAHVLDAYLGRRGDEPLLGAAAPGALMIDCSTIDVADAREAAQAAEGAGYRGVDAPVSGGVGGAAAGTLTFMVGASDADFAEVEPLLDPMAGRIVHCGDVSSGQAAKICNNMILGISMIAVSEAFVLGERLGLTHQALFDVASTASGQCWSLTTYCPVPGPVPTSPANNEYRPGFAAPLMAKDLGLAMKAVADTSTDARLGSVASEIYRAFADGEGATLDFSAIVNEIRGHADTEEETA